jgi:tetraacyldisaccharide 4'-kinase
LYAAAARARRRYYAASSNRQRRLERPVISVGNLAVGGRAKTPTVAHIVSMLAAAGERPSVLTRGYGRLDENEIVVVRDATGVRADLRRAGDEPLMLARRLPGAVVIAGADRYAAGTLAQSQYGCTVHVLDDGFQHLRLRRHIDIVSLAPQDLANPVTLPGGRLREPLDALRAATAVIALDGLDPAAIDAHARVWRARRRLETAQLIEPPDRAVAPSSRAVVALAGIAAPERFFGDLRELGWPLGRTIAFGDHHPYTRADVDRILTIAREEGAAMLVTTEKDVVRLLPFRPFPLPVAFVPLSIEFERAREFDEWLFGALADARGAA